MSQLNLLEAAYPSANQRFLRPVGGAVTMADYWHVNGFRLGLIHIKFDS